MNNKHKVCNIHWAVSLSSITFISSAQTVTSSYQKQKKKNKNITIFNIINFLFISHNILKVALWVCTSWHIYRLQFVLYNSAASFPNCILHTREKLWKLLQKFTQDSLILAYLHMNEFPLNCMYQILHNIADHECSF